MNGERCVRCGAPATVWHHPPGTFGGVYLDQGWTVPPCDACHREEHALRAGLGLDRVPANLHVLDWVIVALRRVAVWAGQFDGLAAPLGAIFAGLARFLAGCADQVEQVVEALDARWPSWRTEIEPIT